MAPIEDLESRDLAWISDFVTQQMVMTLRPMMEHLHQTDATVDYTQRTVQRLSMDVSEVRGDLERTNTYLAILRQGLGAQNEGRCALQRSVESSARTVKRFDEQMDGMLGVVRSVEETVAQLCSDVRCSGAQHMDVAKQVTDCAVSVEELRARIDGMRSDFLGNEARFEVWQRELRELRRNTLGIVTKIESEKPGRPPHSSQGGRVGAGESWPPKKGFKTPVEVGCKDLDAGSVPGSAGCGKVERLGSAARGLLQQDPLDYSVTTRSSSRAQMWGAKDPQDNELTSCADSASSQDASSAGSRLPLLTKQPAASRPSEGPYAAGPRLRFSESMAKPPSRGSPS